MVHIQKNAPPMELIQARRNGLVDYNGMDTPTKDAIKSNLLTEQYHLCAYCMRRIKLDSMQIEHYIAQNPKDADGYQIGQSVDYNNMLGVCQGDKKTAHSLKNLTCDQHRQNEPLTVDPRDPHIEDVIRYKDDGTICSRNKDINRDLDEILNLNCPASRLKENRKAALDALKKKVAGQYGGKSITKAEWERIYKHIDMPEQEKKLEYIGILRWYIKRKIQQSVR